MKTKDYIKAGVGLALGVTAYQITLGVCEGLGKSFLTRKANDDEHMSELKERNPEHYESMKKYRTKKDEEES